MANDFQVLNPQEYYQALCEAVPKAKKRIVLAAMTMLCGDKTNRVFDELERAVGRGVTVTILLDVYTKLTWLYGASNGQTRWKQTKSRLNRLEQLGATIYRYGRIGVVPFCGRCHVKISIVDDQVFSFGGVNFHDEAFKNLDYMLQLRSADCADQLTQLVERIGTGKPPLKNDEIRLDSSSAILFDGGQPNKSIIYDRACELAAQSNRIYYLSQMAPSGRLAQLLASTKTIVLTNRPRQMLPPANWGQFFDLRRHHITNSYHGQTFLHAKFMLFELANGQKSLLCGSHNFSYRGVAYGTQEVALQSTDEKLWGELYVLFRKTTDPNCNLKPSTRSQASITK